MKSLFLCSFLRSVLLYFFTLRYNFYKLYFVSASLFCGASIHAQDKLANNAIQLVAGYSRHGSGDLNGIVFGTEYVKYLSHKFSLNYNIRAMINDGKIPIIINDNTTPGRTDASIRFTTAGVQAGVNCQYSLARNKKHEFLISLGGFGRYQSASNGADGYSLYSPQLTGQPTILVGYNNKTAQETFSIGAIFQIEYNFTFKNDIYIGVLPAFQTDTNGDAIPQVALVIGKRL